MIQDTLDLIVPATLKLSPDGTRSRVLDEGSNGTIERANTRLHLMWIAETDAEKSARPLTDGSFNDRMPCWSPDARSVAFVSDRGCGAETCAIYLVGVDGHKPGALTPENSNEHITNLEFSPNGKFIAFASPYREVVREAGQRGSQG